MIKLSEKLERLIKKGELILVVNDNILLLVCLVVLILSQV